ncbi:MAG: glycosyltransferase [Candidatus Micrarchaeota archaeon]|nr:glycosyltransferase [Candidatus Micrarchaeota archaeon]
MSNRPILSICIPTFQRKEALDDLLRVLTDGIKKYRMEKDIEICVSDNDSFDGTYNMVSMYKKKYSFIRLRKNIENIGCDRNIINVLKMARGRYCWLLNDHAPLISKNIIFLVNMIKKENPFVCGLVTPAHSLKYAKDFFSENIYTRENFLEIYKEYITKTPEEDIPFLGYISCFILNRKKLNVIFRKLRDVKRYYYWTHLSIFLYLLSRFNGKVIVYTDPLILDEQNTQIRRAFRYKILLPHETLDVFYVKRIKTLKILKIDKSLIKAISTRLKKDYQKAYVKQMIKTLILDGTVSRNIYEKIEKKMEAPSRKKLLKGLYKVLDIIIEKIRRSFLRGFLKSVIKTLFNERIQRIIDDFKEYEKGQLLSNEERERLR